MDSPFSTEEKERLFKKLDQLEHNVQGGRENIAKLVLAQGKLEASQTTQTTTLDRLERGMFGENGMENKGLIYDVAKLKQWVAEYKLKAAFLAGIGATIALAAKSIWEWLTKK